ncbi:diadenylate cyclase [Candidatus Woesearchaeota archaeon]|nr:diadenylate cyclase [Candidatus Woesearchaeota archaeon]
MAILTATLLLNQSILKKLHVDTAIIVEKDSLPKEYLEQGEQEKEYLNISIYDSTGVRIANYQQERPDTDEAERFVKSIILEAISQRLIDSNSKVLVLLDREVFGNYDLISFIIEVDRVLFRIGRFKIQDLVTNEAVIDSTINIAREIALEGREGKPIGTLFVIGDYEELKPYLRQLVLNPFYGYPPDLTNITNQELKETIKNFAQLDGAFIINLDGTIISAGTYINTPKDALRDAKIYPGWGTRHLAAVGITTITNSIAVLVSSSGGVVKVFKKGKLILKIKPS